MLDQAKLDQRNLITLKNKNIEYTVLQPRERKVKPRNYGDNFRYIPTEEQGKA